MSRTVFVLLALWTVGLRAGYAQDEVVGMGVRSDVMELRNGRKMLVHTVLVGETLYSISKTYQIGMQDIAAVNGSTLQNLTVGQRIFVPIRSLNPHDRGANYYFFFVAEEDMSLHFAARKYHFEVSEFLRLNPDAKLGIRKGQLIKVPKERSTFAELIAPLDTARKVGVPQLGVDMKPPCEGYRYDRSKDVFRVVALLPLMVSANRGVLGVSPEGLSRAQFNTVSTRFLEYLEGMLMAANELRRLGLNVALEIYDTDKDADRVKKVIDSGAIDKADLVIGPAYSDNFVQVADYLHSAPKAHVSPMSLNTTLIADNEQAYQVLASERSQMAMLADFVVTQQPPQIIALHNGNKTELELIEAFKRQLHESASITGQTIGFMAINYRVGGLSAVRDALKAGRRNVVFVPSENEIFITDIVAKLNTLGLSRSIDVLGLHVWETFSNVSFEELHNLRFTFATTSRVDYDSEVTDGFVREFRERFNAEPSQYVFYGYDTFLYFGQRMHQGGVEFSKCPDLKLTEGLQVGWSMCKDTPLGGYENKTAWIIRYEKGTQLSVFRSAIGQDERVQHRTIRLANLTEE